MQRTVDLIIPRAAFQRVVREVAREIYEHMSRRHEHYRWQALAIEALQEAAETYLVSVFDSMWLARV